MLSRLLGGLVALVTLTGCAGGPAELPDPRPLVVRSGARLTVTDLERMRTIYDEVSRELRAIEVDPSFLIAARPDPRDLYPWETLEIQGDTASISFSRTNPDLRASYEIYAHLHLMRRMGRLDDWIPEAADAEGWELERAIMGRVADSWLMGRAIFDLAPYPLMDQIIYAQDAGYLDALLLSLRPNEFAAEREAWLENAPEEQERFRIWFRETFDREAPGPSGS